MPDDKNQPGTPEEEDPSAQDLLKQVKDLESRVKKAEQEKELHLSGQIEQHNALLAGIKNISPTVEKAEKNLAYFEEAKGKGLLQGEDLAKFEELKKSLEALKKTREETNKKVAAIYGQPEVEGRIQTLAFQENEAFDIVAKGNKLFNEELPKALLGILEDAGNYVQTIADARAKERKGTITHYRFYEQQAEPLGRAFGAFLSCIAIGIGLSPNQRWPHERYCKSQPSGFRGNHRGRPTGGR